MSHQYYQPARSRLQRSELAVPGSSPKMFEKALNSNADYIFLDLEDAVSPNDKITARQNVIKALKEINWREKGKTISVRINSLDTHYMYSDVVEIVEQVGDKVDTILVPKAGTASDVYMVDCLLTQIETNKKFKNKIGIECLIETALGMSNIKEIAKSSSRLEALHFGVADYAASLRARTVVIGGLNPDYPGDQWHHGLSQLVMTCRAYGLRAIDGPFGDFNDPDAYVASAKRAAAIGIEGKWAIHPSQIDLANKVFSPPEAEVNKAKKILEELDKAAKEGKGAAQLDGRMIDAASARMAGVDVTEMRLLNPGYKLGVTHPESPQTLLLPLQSKEIFLISLEETPKEEWYPINIYTVKEGDTLSEIALKNGLSTESLIRSNTIRRHIIQVGQKIKLPGTGLDSSSVTHRVKSGDSLWKIAKKYNISVKNITAWNDINLKKPLKIGKELKISIN